MPHDLEAERTAAAFGGSCDCLQLVDRVVPAARRWLELQLRAEVPQLAVTATGRPLAPCPVCPGPVRSEAGDLLAAVDHLRSIEHMARERDCDAARLQRVTAHLSRAHGLL